MYLVCRLLLEKKKKNMNKIDTYQPSTPSGTSLRYRVFCFAYSRSCSLVSFFFFLCYGDHRDLHSFPTRRSSDLGAGTRELHDRPNVLRVLVGEPLGRVEETPAGAVIVVEANKIGRAHV